VIVDNSALPTYDRSDGTLPASVDLVVIGAGVAGAATAYFAARAGLQVLVIERRSKLRDEFVGFPQDKLRELRGQGVEITKTIDIPLVAYTGDTEPGEFLFREEFRQAQVVVTECTFFEDEHRDRARIGKHMHVEDLRPLFDAWTAKDIVIVHVSRRTLMPYARERIERVAGPTRAPSVHLLMDHRANKARHEAQVAASGVGAAEEESPETATPGNTA
jgi:ribonuclease Z